MQEEPGKLGWQTRASMSSFFWSGAESSAHALWEPLKAREASDSHWLVYQVSAADGEEFALNNWAVTRHEHARVMICMEAGRREKN